jgi:hypothetical protein
MRWQAAILFFNSAACWGGSVLFLERIQAGEGIGSIFINAHIPVRTPSGSTGSGWRRDEDPDGGKNEGRRYRTVAAFISDNVPSAPATLKTILLVGMIMDLPIMPGVVMIVGAVVAAVIVMMVLFSGPMGVRMAVCVAVFVGVHMFMRMHVGLVSMSMLVLVIVGVIMGVLVLVFGVTFHGYLPFSWVHARRVPSCQTFEKKYDLNCGLSSLRRGSPPRSAQSRFSPACDCFVLPEGNA